MTAGITISDKIDHVLSPTLSDILEEVVDGDSYFWSILYIDGMTLPEQGCPLSQLEEKINQPKNGYSIKWKELILFQIVFHQMYDVLVLGDKDCNVLKSFSRYDSEDLMYESCDFVIELIDCTYWKIYSKDCEFIKRLRKKFREVEVLE